MRIDILTLFPEEFEGVIGSSIIKRAVEGHQVEIYVHDYREYSSKKSKRVDDYSLKIGDIITFNSNDSFYKGLTITHRIIGIQQLSDGSKVYRTKGDNNVLPDSSLVHLDHVYGRVFFKIPKLGYIKNFVSSTGGFIISIVIPILFVILYEVFRIKKLIKLQDAEIEII